MAFTLEHVAIACGASGVIAGIVSFGFLGIVLCFAHVLWLHKIGERWFGRRKSSAAAGTVRLAVEWRDDWAE
ncbi:unnamed protein product, partial [Symbiodinium necroappetens]